MASTYPGTIDSTAGPSGSLYLPVGGSMVQDLPSIMLAGVDSAIIAVESALGTNPQGTATDVATRIAAAELVVASLVRVPESLVSGAVTRDANGSAASAPVLWPDGTAGVYTVDARDATGAVNSYHVTYVGGVTKTYTQPAVTRDATGAVVNLPAIVVT